MPGLDVEEFHETDSSDNEENHSQLVSSISQLDSAQRVKATERREITSEVSEYNLEKSLPKRKNFINARELSQVLGEKSEHAIICKKIARVTKKAKTLPKPLEKVTEERIKRSVGFENVKKQLRKWDPVVERNALKDQISFPLNDNTVKMQKSPEFLSQFKTATPLEEEIAKVLKLDNVKETETEDKEFPLTLEEMMEKRREMALLRAKLSYRQAKAVRQSKIKSKKYHRLLKREKIRQQLQEFESLQKSDPEAALKKLSELDKTRAQERASLRHRNTGHWAKNLSVRAKYDVETRKVLAEQLKMSRELTQKVSQLESSDDEEEVEPVLPENRVVSQTKPLKTFEENPWTLDVSKEVDDFVSGYKKYWCEKQKEISKSKISEEGVKENGHDEDGGVIPVKKSEGCEETQRLAESEEKTVESSKTNAEEPQTEKMESPVTNSAEPQAKKKKSPKINSPKKASPEKKETWVSIHPASGVWIVTPVSEAPKIRNKRKADDIDALFDELEEKLTAKAKKKVDRLKKKLTERKPVREKRKKKENSTKKFDSSLKNRNVIERPDMDNGLLEGGEENGDVETPPTVVKASVPAATAAIDPQNFIQVKPKRLRTHLPENITGGEDALDDEKEHQTIIEEAFGGDDVIAEFQERKAEEEKEGQVAIETSLPGWGEWGGSGIVPKRKKRMLVLNLPPRKDKNKKDVIINENENPNLRNHLVKEVPHPFKSVDAFEANIRAPVGREWVPETAHQKLIQRQVVTKLGTIIEPMSEEEIITLKKASKSPYEGKKKSKT